MLSNLRLDRVQELSLYPPFVSGEVRVYGPRPGKETSLKAVLGRLFDGMLLPDIFSVKEPSDIREVKSGEMFQIGDAMVEAIAAHPSDNSLVWKIMTDGQALVYISDAISVADASPELLDFMAGADLALINGSLPNPDAEEAEVNFEFWADELGRRTSSILFSPISSLNIQMKR